MSTAPEQAIGRTPEEPADRPFEMPPRERPSRYMDIVRRQVGEYDKNTNHVTARPEVDQPAIDAARAHVAQAGAQDEMIDRVGGVIYAHEAGQRAEALAREELADEAHGANSEQPGDFGGRFNYEYRNEMDGRRAEQAMTAHNERYDAAEQIRRQEADARRQAPIEEARRQVSEVQASLPVAPEAPRTPGAHRKKPPIGRRAIGAVRRLVSPRSRGNKEQ